MPFDITGNIGLMFHLLLYLIEYSCHSSGFIPIPVRAA